jgi:hypothetical protein
VGSYTINVPADRANVWIDRIHNTYAGINEERRLTELQQLAAEREQRLLSVPFGTAALALNDDDKDLWSYKTLKATAIDTALTFGPMMLLRPARVAGAGAGVSAHEMAQAAMAAEARATRATMLRSVRADLRSADPAKQLEAQVARRYWRDLVAYDRTVLYPGTSRSYAQVDVELRHAIIEVTTGRGEGKMGQINRLMNPLVNPQGTQVIMFSSNSRHVPSLRIRDFNMRGGLVAHGPGAQAWSMLDSFVLGR